MQITFPHTYGNNEVYLDCLNSLVGDKRGSFLDIGCNHAPFTSTFGFEKRKYIDVLHRELYNKEEQQFFEQTDANNYLSGCKIDEFEVTFSLDQIEHVTINYGLKQIQLMQMVSKKQIFFTPLNEWMMTNEDDKNPESHRSIWKPEDITDKFIKLIFPVYHPTLNIGAWFFMNCENNEQEFERIKNELNTKLWAKS